MRPFALGQSFRPVTLFDLHRLLKDFSQNSRQIPLTFSATEGIAGFSLRKAVFDWRVFIAGFSFVGGRRSSIFDLVFHYYTSLRIERNLKIGPHGSDSPLEIRASPVKFIEYESEPKLHAE
jgi:hypothetical protein